MFRFLKLKGTATYKEMAKGVKTTRGNVSNWLARRKQYLTNTERGKWAIK